MINTTLNEILKHEPDKDLWEKLLKHLDKTEADNESLSLTTILEINGLPDAIWCLRCLPKKHAKTIRLFACDIAEHVLHFFEDKFPEDERPRRAINMARLYTEGGCTHEELKAAWFAATYADDAATRAIKAVRDAAYAEAAVIAASADGVSLAAVSLAAVEAASAAVSLAAVKAAEAAAITASAAVEAAAHAASAAVWVADAIWVADGVKTATEAAADAAWCAAWCAEDAVYIVWAAADAVGKTVLDTENCWQEELFVKYFG